jgi:hypothetical protein
MGNRAGYGSINLCLKLIEDLKKSIFSNWKVCFKRTRLSSKLLKLINKKYLLLVVINTQFNVLNGLEEYKPDIFNIRLV